MLVANSQGSFILPSDGTEVEVFINYGKGYEKICVRKGYSFYPDQKQHLLKAIGQEDVTNVKEINRFRASDVAECVEFMLALFSKGADFENDEI